MTRFTLASPAVAFLLAVLALVTTPIFAQVPTGIPQFGTFGKGTIDTVNLATLNAHLEVPVRQTPGRKLPFAAALNQDTAVWYPAYNTQSLSWGWNSPNVSMTFPLRAGVIYGIPVPYTSASAVCTQAGFWADPPALVSVNSNGSIVTLTASSGSPFSIFSAGQQVTLSGFGRATFLNGRNTTILTATSTVVTLSTSGPPNYENSDFGKVSRLTIEWTVQSYTDIHNTTHYAPTMIIDPLACTANGRRSESSTSVDGYVTAATGNPSNPTNMTVDVSVTDPSGTVLDSGPVSGSPLNPGTSTDTNGNKMSVSQSSNVYTYTDSSGNVALTRSDSYQNNQISSTTYSYTGPNSTLQKLVVTYTNLVLQTNFGCSPIVEGGNGQALPLATKITLPNQSFYQIGYEPTPGNPSNTTGRVQSIKLPTGGSITYTYNGPNNGISCLDGGTSAFKRQTPDGTWTYSRSYNATTLMWTTTVTDPQGNNSVYTFSGPTTLNTPNSGFVTAASYEVQRQTSQLINSKQVLMQTLLTCYNTNFNNCATSVVNPPITQIDRYTYLPGLSSSSLSETKYNLGLLTEDKEFDFGATLPPGNNPVSDRVIAYGTYNSSNGSCTSLGKNLISRPCTDSTSGGSSPLSKTTYQYDANGNLLSLGSLVGANYLTKSFTYYSTGLVNVAADINLAQTQFTYGACNSSFPTAVSEPLGLSKSMTWDCVGEALTSVSDENSALTTYSYVDPTTGYLDPFWRVVTVTDPLQNLTHYSYSPTTIEKSLVFNNNLSTIDVLSTADSQGRLYLAQTKQAPGSPNFDTVVQGYDADGRLYSVGIPCVSTASTPCASATTTTTYDNLGRKSQVTDGGGGSVSYNYAPSGTYKNDVLTAVGPPPNGENLKQKQPEYDGLGRLTSVCELTSPANGGITCGQSTTQSGYWTRYKYDTLGHLLGVCQNTTQALTVDCIQSPSAGQQTRTYAYDGLGRLTSEMNPENGTTTYVYDTDSACSFSGLSPTSNGDLISKTDANGNKTCYSYDSLHRVTDIGVLQNRTCFPPVKRFRYDSTSKAVLPAPTGYSAGSGSGRMVEAWTGDCVWPTPSSGLDSATDEWFTYSPRGENTDLWESTAHIAGYFHGIASYAANGALSSIGGIPGYTAIAYGLDGEGRPNTATQGTTNLVMGVTYTSASQPNTISLGTGDSDSYLYDPNTGRMTTYTFTVNGVTDSGGLTWNANGTLGQLAITDHINSGGTQTCKSGAPSASVPGYDDLGRLISDNCGSVWAQTFSYDPFGNITKAGSSQWMPGYNSATNHAMLPFAYDNNGNMTNDTFHTYGWYVDNKLGSTDSTTCTIFGSTNGTCVLYDALGRAVERGVNGVYTELMYTPVGKTAIMSGQTSTVSAYFPLPGGGTYFQSGSTGANGYFWHKDWLGTVRLSSSLQNRTSYFDRAFAPYGEMYSNFGNATGLSFTGDTQDSFTGLFDTPSREVSSGESRWLSPDPMGQSADVNNPQSWNRYAYVLNNPLVAIDPSGLDCIYVAENAISTGDSSFNVNEVTVRPGDCASPTDIGYYVDGTVDTRSWKVDTNGDISVGYTDENGAYGTYLAEGAIDPADNAANNDSWGWTFTKSFFGGIVSSAGWKAVYHSFGEAGCDRLMFETFAGDFNPLPDEGPSASDAAELSPMAVAQTGRTAASAYSLYQGLSVPLRSSIYRGLQSSTYGISATLEEVVPYAQVGYAGGHALYTAGSAAYNGECH